MLPMRSIVESKSNPLNSSSWKCCRSLSSVKDLRMILAEVLAGRNQKPCRAACRITNHVVGRRLYHLNHQTDDVPRCAKLSVLSRRRDLAEHVFVKVALGIPILHRDLVDHVDDLCEQRRHWES